MKIEYDPQFQHPILITLHQHIEMLTVQAARDLCDELTDVLDEIPEKIINDSDKGVCDE